MFSIIGRRNCIFIFFINPGIMVIFLLYFELFRRLLLLYIALFSLSYKYENILHGYLTNLILILIIDSLQYF